MAEAAPAVQPPKEKQLPYVGLRPFERYESDRLFGRDRDAQILCDRTLSGRLTILYAQSGLGKWVEQARADRSDGKTGLTTAEREELSRLRKENRELRMEREILKKAAAFFAKESK